MDGNSSGRPRVAPALAASFGIVLLWLIVVFIATSITQAVRPPSCFGIGFGCTPDAGAATLITALVFGLPALVIAWVITLIGWAGSARAESDKARRWLVWGAPAALAGVAVLMTVLSTVGELLD